jgi:hypothetical protein
LATGGIEMLPMPLLPGFHPVGYQEGDQFHATETPFPVVHVVEVGQPVISGSHDEPVF